MGLCVCSKYMLNCQNKQFYGKTDSRYSDYSNLSDTLITHVFMRIYQYDTLEIIKVLSGILLVINGL